MKKKIINNFTSEISKSLKKIKLKNKKNIYVTSNLSAIGRVPVEKKIKLKIILEEIKKSMGKNYTIFSPAATMNLCNTQNVFDLYNTPSYKMGPLAEYIRKKNSVRSAHPYWSISGIGKNKNLIKNSSAHGYGVGSPWSTMLDLNTTQLNIGINPERAVTLIHHIETIVGVPYRYNKEFKHKIKKKNKIEEKKFYLSVRFKNIKI